MQVHVFHMLFTMLNSISICRKFNAAIESPVKKKKKKGGCVLI